MFTIATTCILVVAGSTAGQPAARSLPTTMQIAHRGPGGAVTAAAATEKQGLRLFPTPKTTRPRKRLPPPFPGATKLDQILENVRIALIAQGKDDTPGLEILRHFSKIKVSRFFEVERDSDENYYWVELDRPDDVPLLTVLVGRTSGLLVADALDYLVKGRRPRRVPDLDEVEEPLRVQYGATRPRYFLEFKQNLGTTDFFLPMISADTPKGRLLVTGAMEVFEETGFRKDPPGLSKDAKAELRARQYKEARVIDERTVNANDGAYSFRHLGKLDIPRR